MNLTEMFKKYAEVAIKIGVNIQPGQELIINAPVESIELVRACVDEAYKAGASEVITFFADDQITLSRYNNSKPEYIEHNATWLATGLTEGFRQGAARLVILGRNPTLLKDVDPAIVGKASSARGKVYKELMDLVTSSHSQWSIISYATEEWARQVFPELVENDNPSLAINELWKNIFESCRLNNDDPVNAWKEHNKKLHERSKRMNDVKFDYLRFVGDGTDLTVGLADGHIWEGGEGKTSSGIPFNANIPTEEIFTTPDRNNVNGKVKSTKPLLYRGTMIDGIEVTFKDGAAIEVSAKDGEKVLLDMVNTDEGANRIGEVALVPDNSPISNTGVLFKETLFDENASCHIAFGQSYTKCMTEKDGETKEEYMKRGGNFSEIHVDWMIGSKNVNVFGSINGIEKRIIKDGEWIL